MKRFIVQTGIFFAILLTGYVLLSWFVNANRVPPNDYLAAMELKHQRLKNTPSPRIIIAGGSNVTFGIDSELLETELNLPVVNLGIHAGLGLDFMLEELESVTRPGDIVLLIPEYFLHVQGEYELQTLASSLYPPASEFYEEDLITDLKAHFSNNRKNLRNILNRVPPDTNTIYRKKSFNSRGDMVAHLDLPDKETLTAEAVINYKYWEGIDRMNHLSAKLDKRNATLIFMFPVLAESKFNKSREEISALKRDLENDLNAKILGEPQDFMFKDSYFYNTVYHPNAAGRQLRTEKMILLLKNSELLSTIQR